MRSKLRVALKACKKRGYCKSVAFRPRTSFCRAFSANTLFYGLSRARRLTLEAEPGALPRLRGRFGRSHSDSISYRTPWVSKGTPRRCRRLSASQARQRSRGGDPFSFSAIPAVPALSAFPPVALPLTLGLDFLYISLCFFRSLWLARFCGR
jgi:hypothetical protein